jgi:hypothetical protein
MLRNMPTDPEYGKIPSRKYPVFASCHVDIAKERTMLVPNTLANDLETFGSIHKRFTPKRTQIAMDTALRQTSQVGGIQYWPNWEIPAGVRQPQSIIGSPVPKAIAAAAT